MLIDISKGQFLGRAVSTEEQLMGRIPRPPGPPVILSHPSPFFRAQGFSWWHGYRILEWQLEATQYEDERIVKTCLSASLQY